MLMTADPALRPLPHFFGTDEALIKEGSCHIEQPGRGGGKLFLTARRLILISRRGFISVKETPLLDAQLPDISYVRVEGSVFRVLVVGVRKAGETAAYRISIQNPSSWMEAISKATESQGGLPAPPSTSP
jgi:hypothetical protein